MARDKKTIISFLRSQKKWLNIRNFMRVIIALTVSIVTLAATKVFDALNSEFGAYKKVGEAYDLIERILDEMNFTLLIDRSPFTLLLILFVVTFFATYLFKNSWLDAVLRFLKIGEYDDTYLTRIKAVRLKSEANPETGELPWQLGDGRRKLVYDRLISLIQEGRGTGCVHFLTPWKRPKCEQKLGYVLLLGRPGSGKSRLAIEALRQLAQRQKFGPDSFAAQVLFIFEWLRRLIWFLPYGPDDPWDVGQIDNRNKSYWMSLSHDKGNPDKIRFWKPLRPTILWLDDPSLGECKAIYQRLQASVESFDYPVRLLITNQTVPYDIDDKKDAFGPPLARLTLHGKTYFNETDVRVLSMSLGAAAIHLRTSEQIKHLLDITKGNPLLVEMAFDRLRAGQTLKDMDSDVLLDERIERIKMALRTSGQGSGDILPTLACATLGGPICPAAPVEKAGFKVLLKTQWEALFPAEQVLGVDLANYLPSIRPEMIGDHFIRDILSEVNTEKRALISQTAFKAAPSAWLRAFDRLSGGDDVLAKLLRSLPIIAQEDHETRQKLISVYLLKLMRQEIEADIAFDHIKSLFDEIPAAHKKQVILVLKAQFDRQLDYELQYRSAIAQANIETLNDASDMAALDILDLEQDETHRFFHVNEILAAGLWLMKTKGETLHGRDYRRTQAYYQTFITDLKSILTKLTPYGTPTRLDNNAAEITKGIKAILADFDINLFDGLFILSKNLGLYPFNNRLPANSHTEFAKFFAQGSDPKLQILSLTHEVCALYSDPKARLEVVNRVEAITAHPKYADDRDMQYQRAAAWQYLAYARTNDPKACLEAVNRIETITAQAVYADDRDMQHERAKAWQYLAYARTNDPKACLEAVNRVETITAQAVYADDRDMQYQRAQAWAYLAAALKADPKACLEAVNRVEAITALPIYADDRDMQCERASAWRYNAAACNGPIDCLEAVNRVEAITSLTIYADDHDMQFQCAAAWEYLAYARDNPEARLEAVNRVEAITAQAVYADDRNMQFERAQAWRHLAFARKDNPKACLEAVNRVEAITAQAVYADDRGMQHQRAQAWRILAFARRNDAKACLEAVNKFETITARPVYADDRDMQRERADAWKYLAYARDNPEACLEAVNRVEAITAQPVYADDRDVQHQRAEAWSYLAAARKDDPESCLEAVNRVEAITTHAVYADDRDMQHARATAWRYLAFARRNDAKACLEAVHRVETITAQAVYADDRDMQHARANAWRHLAFAHKNDAKVCLEAVNRVEAIAANPRFSSDQVIIDEMNKARSYLPQSPTGDGQV